MKKIIYSTISAIIIFLIGLIADNPFIACMFVVPFIMLACSYLPQKKGGTNIPPLKQEAPLPKPRKQLHHTFISGIKYYDADALIQNIDFSDVEESEDWMMSRKELIEDDNHERIWHYEQIDMDAYIEHEPTNEHDSNALKVIVEIQGRTYMLGYVPKEKQEDVKDAERYFVTINGGEYKQLTEDDELIKDMHAYTFNLEWIK